MEATSAKNSKPCSNGFLAKSKSPVAAQRAGGVFFAGGIVHLEDGGVLLQHSVVISEDGLVILEDGLVLNEAVGVFFSASLVFYSPSFVILQDSALMSDARAVFDEVIRVLNEAGADNFDAFPRARDGASRLKIGSATASRPLFGTTEPEVSPPY